LASVALFCLSNQGDNLVWEATPTKDHGANIRQPDCAEIDGTHGHVDWYANNE
jgi:hypothetical protein